jgi:hypothetical protein
VYVQTLPLVQTVMANSWVKQATQAAAERGGKAPGDFVGGIIRDMVTPVYKKIESVILRYTVNFSDSQRNYALVRNRPINAWSDRSFFQTWRPPWSFE